MRSVGLGSEWPTTDRGCARRHGDGRAASSPASSRPAPARAAVTPSRSRRSTTSRCRGLDVVLTAGDGHAFSGDRAGSPPAAPSGAPTTPLSSATGPNDLVWGYLDLARVVRAGRDSPGWVLAVLCRARVRQRLCGRVVLLRAAQAERWWALIVPSRGLREPHRTHARALRGHAGGHRHPVVAGRAAYRGDRRCSRRGPDARDDAHSPSPCWRAGNSSIASGRFAAASAAVIAVGGFPFAAYLGLDHGSCGSTSATGRSTARTTGSDFRAPVCLSRPATRSGSRARSSSGSSIGGGM